MGYDWVINLGDGTGSEFLTAAHLSIFICELKQRLMTFLLFNAFEFPVFLSLCGLCMIVYFDSTFFKSICLVVLLILGVRPMFV